MGASEARKIAQKNKKAGYTSVRLSILAMIKKQTEIGNFNLTLTDIVRPVIHATEEDYVFFENLGYKIKRPEKRPLNKFDYYMSPAIISWD